MSTFHLNQSYGRLQCFITWAMFKKKKEKLGTATNKMIIPPASCEHVTKSIAGNDKDTIQLYLERLSHMVKMLQRAIILWQSIVKPSLVTACLTAI